MNRWASLTILGFTLAAFTFFAPASSAQQRRALGLHVRFDLPQILQNTVLAGGKDVGLDGPTGDAVELTGSGEFTPGAGHAAGGGTFVHKHSTGTEVAHGVWVVTSFAGWRPGGGSLPSVLTDGIGEIAETSAGIVALHVQLVPEGGESPLDAILEVHCHLPGASFDTEEGIRLIVGPFVFEQDPVLHGVTLFHILQ